MPKLLFTGKKLLTEFGETLNKISKELYDFYIEMLENDYIDIDYLELKILSHEFGHAFQKYNASLEDKKYIVSPLLKYPTFEIAEMFSYAMEIICMRHADNLFDTKDYNKYCFMKFYNLVSMMPYMCLVDEFQEVIYTNK